MTTELIISCRLWWKLIDHHWFRNVMIVLYPNLMLRKSLNSKYSLTGKCKLTSRVLPKMLDTAFLLITMARITLFIFLLEEKDFLVAERYHLHVDKNNVYLHHISPHECAANVNRDIYCTVGIGDMNPILYVLHIFMYCFMLGMMNI